MKADVDACIEASYTFDEFVAALERRGYAIHDAEDRRELVGILVQRDVVDVALAEAVVVVEEITMVAVGADDPRAVGHVSSLYGFEQSLRVLQGGFLEAEGIGVNIRTV